MMKLPLLFTPLALHLFILGIFLKRLHLRMPLLLIAVMAVTFCFGFAGLVITFASVWVLMLVCYIEALYNLPQTDGLAEVLEGYVIMLPLALPGGPLLPALIICVLVWYFFGLWAAVTVVIIIALITLITVIALFKSQASSPPLQSRRIGNLAWKKPGKAAHRKASRAQRN